MADTSETTLPLVDFARLRSAETRDEELAKLRHALFTIGFLYLVNSGLEVGLAVLWCNSALASPLLMIISIR